MPNQMDQSERNAEIYKAKLAGEKLESIGERFGLTRQRVLQIIQNFEKQEERNSGPFKGLPPQIIKVLRRSGINSLEEAQKLSDAELAGIKNISTNAARQIMEWKL
jgi:hypothetical protein